jgi:cysteinyl-tRNA synthetase
LESHYRSPLSYSSAGAAARERSMERLRHALRPAGSAGKLDDELPDPQPFRDRFLNAMDNDLNTPQALACLFDLAREINRAVEAGRNACPAQDALRELGGILGLTFQERASGDQHRLAAKPFIDLLVNTRLELRRAKQYALADQIRDELAKQGVTVEDTPQGSEWQYQSTL